MGKKKRSGKSGTSGMPKQSKQAVSQSQKSSFTMGKNDWVSLLILVGLTFLVFSNTLDNEFVNWDDDRNFYENEHITTLNKENFWANTVKIFSTPVIGNYNPLSIWSFLIDQKLYGLDDPGGWHLTNVILHVLTVLFVFLVGRRLGLSTIASFFLAGLFAIHPMRVESVAWVTERKDVLFGLFFFMAIWNYLKFRQDNNKRARIGLYLCFALSLLSKIQAVSLPLALVAVDYLLDKRLSWKMVFSKIPLFVLSLIVGLLGIYFLSAQGSLETNADTYANWQRPFVGSYSYIVYLIKSVVPYEMSPLYPYPNKMPWTFYVSMPLALAFVWLVFKAYKAEKHIAVFGVIFFTVNIVFLLQVLGAGQGFTADRFTYVAYFGLFFIAAYYLDTLIGNEKFRKAALGGSAVLLITYSLLAYNQNEVWTNSGTLWSHVLKNHENTPLPWGNRANYLRKQGRIQEALYDYGRALNLKANPQTYNSRARLYFDHSNNRDTLLLALQDYNKAIELKPDDGEFYTNRGATYARLGDMNSALADLSKALELKPDHGVAYLNRSLLYNAQGRFDLALSDIDNYLKLQPYKSDIWYEKGRVLHQLNRVQESIQAYDRAIQLNNGNPVYFYGRSRAHFTLGNTNQAISDIRYAESLGYREIDPAYKSQLGM